MDCNASFEKSIDKFILCEYNLINTKVKEIINKKYLILCKFCAIII